MRCTTNLILPCAFVLMNFVAPTATAQSGPVPAEWQGTWVPVKAACDSAVHVLIAEFDGQQPVTAVFNAGEKKGIAQVSFAPVQPGAAGNALLTACNKRITELNLAKRFPLHEVPLKKCGAAP